MKNQQIALEKPTSEFLKDFSIKSRTYTESSLIESLRALRSYIPLPSEVKEKNTYVERIVREWFSQRVRKKYDELSPEIFNLKREIEVNAKYFKDDSEYSCSELEKVRLEIPMLVQAELNKDEGWKDKRNYPGKYRYELSLFSRIPKVPSNIREAARESIGFAYRTYGDALATDVLSEVINENPEYAPHPKDAKLLVLWKPKPSDIHIEVRRLDNDPALVLNWNKPYLVSTWKEPDEEPFMDLVSACRVPNLEMFIEEEIK
jgi:hypothetical protein